MSRGVSATDYPASPTTSSYASQIVGQGPARTDAARPSGQHDRSRINSGACRSRRTRRLTGPTPISFHIYCRSAPVASISRRRPWMALVPLECPSETAQPRAQTRTAAAGLLQAQVGGLDRRHRKAEQRWPDDLAELDRQSVRRHGLRGERASAGSAGAQDIPTRRCSPRPRRSSGHRHPGGDGARASFASAWTRRWTPQS